jgi:hypothetical protein
MKGLSVFLVLAVAVSFGLMSCSDNTDPIVGPTSQGVAQGEAPSLAKGPVVASVAGSGHIRYNFWVDGKQVYGTLTVSARKYADGSVDGQYQIIDHAVECKSFAKWHGRVLSLEVFGNQAFVGGVEVKGEDYLDWYDAFLLVDNGNGASSPDLRSYVYSEPPSNYTHMRDVIWKMTPEEFVTLLETEWVPGSPAFMEVTNGNIHVR